MDSCTIGILVVAAFSCFCLIMLGISKHDEGYKQGQIDAINGKIVYKLCEFEDGTRAYYKESELKDLKEHIIIEL